MRILLGQDRVAAAGSKESREPRRAGEVARAMDGRGKAVVVGERTSKLSDRFAADDVAREQRLEEITRQIEEGTYDLDLDLLAERLVDEEISRSRSGK
jgi:anti-sigma28 factor (negative regulator of flagellin synthesis)